jgi:hypothetical protein
MSRSQWPRRLVVGLRPLAAAIVGSNPTGGMDVCMLCFHVEASVMNWSLIQRSPTDCGASLCVIWKLRVTRRPWKKGAEPLGNAYSKNQLINLGENKIAC